jgi:thiamine-phosphate pyrophosphorylase
MALEPRGSSRAPTVTLVTDPRWPFERIERVIEAAASALAPGALLVQLRDKEAGPAALMVTARSLRATTARSGARFIVNAATQQDDVFERKLRVAVDAGADGVHVPCRPRAIARARSAFGDRGWISTPAHTDEEVVTAAGSGATLVLVSPIWDSPGKGRGRGVAAISSARARAGPALLHALGGVDGSRAAACAGAGADGVAVIRALLDASDPAAEARRLDAPFHSGTRG